MAINWGNAVLTGFDKLTPQLGQIEQDARQHDRPGWIQKQTALAAAGGGAAMAIPGIHLLAFGADVAFLMNRMSVVSYGIGAITCPDDGFVEQEDFALVLGVWTKETPTATLSQAAHAMAAKATGKVAMKVGGKAGAKWMAKSLAHALGVMAGKKLGPKITTKVGAKFAGKMAAKGGAGWVPWPGAAVGAGINGYFVDDIAKAAIEYYEAKAQPLTSITT